MDKRNLNTINESHTEGMGSSVGQRGFFGTLGALAGYLLAFGGRPSSVLAGSNLCHSGGESVELIWTPPTLTVVDAQKQLSVGSPGMMELAHKYLYYDPSKYTVNDNIWLRNVWRAFLVPNRPKDVARCVTFIVTEQDKVAEMLGKPVYKGLAEPGYLCQHERPSAPYLRWVEPTLTPGIPIPYITIYGIEFGLSHMEYGV